MEAEALAGKVALVTGGAVRVGRAIALALGRAGADVAVHYATSAGEAEATAAEIRRLGRRAETVGARLERGSECEGLVHRVIEVFGRLDFLVHSAANFHRASLAETDEAVWASSMNVNARAGFLMARAAASELAARKGRVVLLSDFLGRDPARHYLAHSVSKAAVEGLVRALAVELAPDVLVNGVAPGNVLLPEGTSAEEAARWASKVPLKRIGEPEDVAEAVLFLCAGPSFMTGHVLRVDGGKDLT